VSVGMRAPGLLFFQVVATINMVFVSVFAIGLFSTAITEEKESESLSLLMMTGISPLGMLLSKGASKFISGMMLVLAQFPFTVLSVTLGGISLKQVITAYIIIIAYMFMLCNLALFFSVFSKKSSEAGSFTLGSIILFFVLCGNVSVLQFINPFIKLDEVLGTGYTGFYLDLCSISNILLGLFFFMLALGSFNRFTREKGEGVPVMQKVTHSKKKIFKIIKMERPWKNALAWKEFHFVGGGWTIFLFSYFLMFLCLFLICYFGFYEARGRAWNEMLESIPYSLFFLGLLFFSIKLIYLASRMFGSEVWDKTLQEIVILPISLRMIVIQKMKGGFVMLLPSLSFLVVGFFLILLSGKIPLEISEGMFLGLSYILLYVLKFVFFLYVVVYMSLSVKYAVIIISFLVASVISMLIGIPGTALIFIGSIGFGIYGGLILMIISILISVGSYVIAILIAHRMTRSKLMAVIENCGM